ncbi:MAG: Holliday junction resolvase RuvX [Ruminococcaceae bacterium]|nr:Holliday junction resolvase RuvX [Oscillospiraceae bacterium]
MQRLLQTKGKILGIDFGDKRTGLAVSDVTRFLASGIGQISVGGMQKTAARISEIVIEQNVKGGIVIGLPVNMNGSLGPRAEHAQKFASILGELLEKDERTKGLPIVMVDERMSTMVAARYLNETDTRGQKRKGVIDTLSAQIILQDALDTLKNMAK